MRIGEKPFYFSFERSPKGNLASSFSDVDRLSEVIVGTERKDGKVEVRFFSQFFFFDKKKPALPAYMKWKRNVR